MNTEILNKIGEFVDKYYFTYYKIEGFYGFAYVTILNAHGEIIEQWKFDSNGKELMK
jgi:hypothetical protein